MELLGLTQGYQGLLKPYVEGPYCGPIIGGLPIYPKSAQAKWAGRLPNETKMKPNCEPQIIRQIKDYQGRVRPVMRLIRPVNSGPLAMVYIIGSHHVYTHVRDQEETTALTKPKKTLAHMRTSTGPQYSPYVTLLKLPAGVTVPPRLLENLLVTDDTELEAKPGHQLGLWELGS